MFWIPVLINFKICDNSADCSGLSSCPNGVFLWDDKKKTLRLDNSKCSSCDVCEPSCPVGAIRVAKTAVELSKIKKEISLDKRKVSDLFVDRYGAQPLHEAFFVTEDKFDDTINSSKLVVVEFFNNASINCLYNSIPIRDLFLSSEVKYRKVSLSSNKFEKKFGVSALPALLFFFKGKLVGKLEGHFAPNKKVELVGKINSILSSVGQK